MDADASAVSIATVVVVSVINGATEVCCAAARVVVDGTDYVVSSCTVVG